MCNLCAVVPGGSITNDKCDVKNKIHIPITASCMVQEAVLLYNELISFLSCNRRENYDRFKH